jgi:hypothetical protein
MKTSTIGVDLHYKKWATLNQKIRFIEFIEIALQTMLAVCLKAKGLSLNEGSENHLIIASAFN